MSNINTDVLSTAGSILGGLTDVMPELLPATIAISAFTNIFSTESTAAYRNGVNLQLRNITKSLNKIHQEIDTGFKTIDTDLKKLASTLLLSQRYSHYQTALSDLGMLKWTAPGNDAHGHPVYTLSGKLIEFSKLNWDAAPSNITDWFHKHVQADALKKACTDLSDILIGSTIGGMMGKSTAPQQKCLLALLVNKTIRDISANESEIDSKGCLNPASSALMLEGYSKLQTLFYWTCLNQLSAAGMVLNKIIWKSSTNNITKSTPGYTPVTIKGYKNPVYVSDNNYPGDFGPIVELVKNQCKAFLWHVERLVISQLNPFANKAQNHSYHEAAKKILANADAMTAMFMGQKFPIIRGRIVTSTSSTPPASGRFLDKDNKVVLGSQNITGRGELFTDDGSEYGYGYGIPKVGDSIGYGYQFPAILETGEFLTFEESPIKIFRYESNDLKTVESTPGVIAGFELTGPGISGEYANSGSNKVGDIIEKQTISFGEGGNGQTQSGDVYSFFATDLFGGFELIPRLSAGDHKNITTILNTGKNWTRLPSATGLEPLDLSNPAEIKISWNFQNLDGQVIKNGDVVLMGIKLNIPNVISVKKQPLYLWLEAKIHNRIVCTYQDGDYHFGDLAVTNNFMGGFSYQNNGSNSGSLKKSIRSESDTGLSDPIVTDHNDLATININTAENVILLAKPGDKFSTDNPFLLATNPLFKFDSANPATPFEWTISAQADDYGPIDKYEFTGTVHNTITITKIRLVWDLPAAPSVIK